VERCIGLLKGRWLCLGSAGGTLLYTPQKVCDIILACGVLHNIAQSNGVPFDVQMLQEGTYAQRAVASTTSYEGITKTSRIHLSLLKCSCLFDNWSIVMKTQHTCFNVFLIYYYYLCNVRFRFSFICFNVSFIARTERLISVIA